jgi:hypothetical protein
MNQKKHLARHIKLHKALDELMADMISSKRGALPSKTTVLELMAWSATQCKPETITDPRVR